VVHAPDESKRRGAALFIAQEATLGPISRAAVIKAQEADTRFKSAVLDELQGIRAALNTLTGRTSIVTGVVPQRTAWVIPGTGIRTRT
jgi:hypothetical protein